MDILMWNNVNASKQLEVVSLIHINNDSVHSPHSQFTCLPDANAIIVAMTMSFIKNPGHIQVI